MWEHHDVHLGCYTQGRDEREIVLHLGTLYEGAMTIEADAHGSPSYAGGEVRLDVLDYLLPWFILTHDTYRQRRAEPKGETYVQVES